HDGDVTVRRVAEDSQILRLPAPEPGDPPDISFGPDGRFLALTHYPRAEGPHRHRVWALPRGELVLDVPTDRPGARLAFSPDGRRLAAGRPGHRLSIFDLSTFQEVRHLEGIPHLAQLSFHPRGRLLALSDSVDRVVQVRDVDTGAIAATLP